jgi:hypothetical protein
MGATPAEGAAGDVARGRLAEVRMTVTAPMT